MRESEFQERRLHHSNVPPPPYKSENTTPPPSVPEAEANAGSEIEENGKNQVQRKAWQTVVLVVLYTNFICGTIALVVCVGTQTSPLLDGLTIESDKQQKSTGNQLHRRYLEPYSAWGRYMGLWIILVVVILLIKIALIIWLIWWYHKRRVRMRLAERQECQERQRMEE